MKNSKPLITTIIPTYRRPIMLKKAIQSFLNQSYPYFQVCIYDNASGDETKEVVADYIKKDSRIKYYCHKTNIGAINNFQFGLKRVKTKYFHFISDDDMVLPDFYKKAIESLEKYPEAFFFGGSSINIRTTGEIFHVPILSWKREGLYIPPDGIVNMCNGNHPNWSAVLFRKEVLNEIGTLDLETKRASDLDFELRIAAIRPFIISTKPCSLFLAHPDSSCKTEDANDAWDGWSKMIDNLQNDKRIQSETKIIISALLWKSIRRRVFIIGIKQIDDSNFSGAEETINLLEYEALLRAEFYAKILKTTAKVCKSFKPIHLLYILTYKIFKLIKKRSYKKINTMYKDFKKFL
jgi:glycosyltransferase involved in cell wall biosynthesis